MRVFFVTTGTRGDLLPFLGLARIAESLGFDRLLLANADHAALARRWNVPFQAICDADGPQEGREPEHFFSARVMPGYRAIHDTIMAARADRQSAMIVARSGDWGAQFTAERLNLVFGRIALQPCAIRPHGHPMSTGQIGQLNRWRASLGLAPLPYEGAVPEWSTHTLSLFPDWFGAPQSQTPEAGRSIGFVFPDQSPEPPPGPLVRFLARHGRIAVFSAGTGVTRVETLYAAAEIFARQGPAVVFLSAHAPVRRQDPRVLSLSHADHGWLLRHARLLVSHGGVGAVAQAIRAAVPHIVLPLDFDQPDNAARVEALGLGAALSPTASAEHILTAYKRLRADPDLVPRLARAAARVDTARTAHAAASWLTDLAGTAENDAGWRGVGEKSISG